MPSSNQRREASRRQLQRQLERRQVQEQRRRRVTLIASIAGTVLLALVIVIFVVATSNDHKKPAAASNTPTPTATPTATPTPARTPGVCDFAASGTAARKVTVPARTAPTKGSTAVSVTTNLGKMTFTLDRAAAPCTVESFVSLVKQKFYDNTACHRLTTTGIYVLQCGDPTGTGTGGPGYTIPDEYTNSEKYSRGVLAMANTGAPNSGGSQFFIVYKDTSLPSTYTVFGTVTQGIGVVDEVAAKGTNNSNGSGDGKPNLKITLEKLIAG